MRGIPLVGLFLPVLLAWLAAPLLAQPSRTGAVVVGDRVVLHLSAAVAGITPAERAAIVNQRIERVLIEPDLRPEEIATEPPPDGQSQLIGLPGLPLLGVTEADARAEGVARDELADRWTRILRDTLVDVKPLYRPADQEHGPSFLPLLLVSSLAFIVPLLAARFRRITIPVVVGEILLGVLVGRSGLNLVGYDASVQFLSEFGFAFLMFLSGLEVDVDLLASRPGGESAAGWRGPAGVAAAVVALTLLLAGGTALLLRGAGLVEQPAMTALVLATVSLGLVVPILKERGLTASTYGQTLLLTALLADFATMFLITIVAGWVSSGLTLRLFLGLLVVVVFAIALRAGHVAIRSPRIAALFEGFSHATTQLPVRGSLALMLAFVAIAQGLGTETILGAFLAGVLIALVAGRSSLGLHHKLEAIGFGFFIPIFFIMVGARFDLKALLTSPQGLALAPVLTIAAILVKVAGALPLRRLFSWRETLAGGLLISPGLSLVIAAAEIGKRLNLFSEPQYAALIAVALVTGVGGPMGFQLVTARSRPETATAGAEPSA